MWTSWSCTCKIIEKKLKIIRRLYTSYVTTTTDIINHRLIATAAHNANAQLHSIKSEFCASLTPAHGLLEIWDGENLQQRSRLEITLNTFHPSTILQKQFIIIKLKKSFPKNWSKYYNFQSCQGIGQVRSFWRTIKHILIEYREIPEENYNICKTPRKKYESFQLKLVVPSHTLHTSRFIAGTVGEIFK